MILESFCLVELVGGFGLGATMMLGWVFRTTSAPFALKLLLPFMLSGLAVGTSFAICSVMGYPVDTRLEDLPQNARLVSFIEDNRQSKVDLWLQEHDQSPRAWRVEETIVERRALAQARKQLLLGTAVYVMRGMGADGQHFAIKAVEPPTKD